MDPEIRALRDVWENEYASTEFDWPVIQAHLHEAAASMRTVLINSKSADTLDYAGHSKTGLSVVAVGGVRLVAWTHA